MGNEMGGKGPSRKSDDTRARRNADPMAAGLKVVEIEPVKQPRLPVFDVRTAVDGELVYSRFKWPARTVAWWRMWKESPLSADYTATDWEFLLDTALLHAKVWGESDLKLLPELRLRVAKFGATPEDRARLRIVFAAAAEGETAPDEKPTAKTRYNGLRSVGGSDTA